MVTGSSISAEPGTGRQAKRGASSQPYWSWRSGATLDDDELRALGEELEKIGEEAAPHYEELERQIESLTRELEPTRERMRTLSIELQREVDAWRLRHQELLNELEEDGITVPSYDGDPDSEDVEPDLDDDPDSDPVPDSEVVESFA